MIRNDPGISSIPTINPLVAQTLQGAVQPVFDSNPCNLPKFKREWSDYEQLMVMCGVGDIPEKLWLLILKGCLKGGAELRLETTMRLNPNLTRKEVWRELESRYGGDSDLAERNKWYQLRLVRTGIRPYDLTLANWEAFEAAFNAQKMLVFNRTDEEEHRLIMQQLPRALQEKVYEEQVRRFNDSKCVRVVIPPNRSIDEVLQFLEQKTEFQFVGGTPCGTGVLIDCGDSDLHELVLSLDGSKMDNDTIQISYHQRQMCGEEIFNFITQKLRIEQEISDFRRVNGGVHPGSGLVRGVDQVATTDPSTFAFDSPRGGGEEQRAVAKVEYDQRRPYPQQYASTPTTQPEARGADRRGRSPSPYPRSGKGGKGQSNSAFRSNAPNRFNTPSRSNFGSYQSQDWQQVPSGKGKGGGKGSTNNFTPGGGKGKGFQPNNSQTPARYATAGSRSFTPQRNTNLCWECQENGRDSRHSYRTCEYHLAAQAQRYGNGSRGNQNPQGSNQGTQPRDGVANQA